MLCCVLWCQSGLGRFFSSLFFFCPACKALEGQPRSSNRCTHRRTPLEYFKPFFFFFFFWDDFDSSVPEIPRDELKNWLGRGAHFSIFFRWRFELVFFYVFGGLFIGFDILQGGREVRRCSRFKNRIPIFSFVQDGERKIHNTHAYRVGRGHGPTPPAKKFASLL